MINLSLVSPSTVGQYAACNMRLVHDSNSPQGRRSSPAADFGTVCHYIAMTRLGCGPLEPPKDAQIECAATRFASIEEMTEQAEKCAALANSKLPTLTAGSRWLAELHVHDLTLLPDRVNRKGEKKGYGGSIDLLMSDNSHVVDYKFTSELPDYVKVEYVWQMGSYSFLREVPLTTILFTTKDAKQSSSTTIDWRVPMFAEFRKAMRTFVHRIGLDDFERYAYPVAGDHCNWCDHKSRCGAHPNNVPGFNVDAAFASPNVNMKPMEDIRRLLALNKGLATRTPQEIESLRKQTVATLPKIAASGVMLDAEPKPLLGLPGAVSDAVKTNLF